MDFIAVLFAISFVFGSLFGSFLNVVVWRVPRGESIVSPPSHCPKCGNPVRWWRNIPIISWLCLRGRCADCGEPISPRYITVEILTGVLFMAAFWRYGFFAPLAWVWISLMVIGSFIDFDHQLLPDFVTVGGMVYGLAVSAAFWAIGSFTPYHFHNITPHCFYITPLDSIFGLAAGFSLLWAVRSLGTLAFRREAMGMGDVFLLGAVGAVSGPVAAVAVIILSSLIGSVAGVALIALSKTKLGSFTAIPFGPYICLGHLAWMFWGQELLEIYLHLLGFK